MKNVVCGLLITSALFIWLLGWFGVGIVALFLLYAFCLPHKKSGPALSLVEKLGTGDDLRH